MLKHDLPRLSFNEQGRTWKFSLKSGWGNGWYFLLCGFDFVFAVVVCFFSWTFLFEVPCCFWVILGWCKACLGLCYLDILSN